MPIFPDYIYQNILSLIINQIYVVNKRYQYSPISNELINYILVSKKWFEFCSLVTGDIISLDNYDNLKSFTEESTISTSTSTNNNKEYKLLSTKRNFGKLIKVYTSMKTFYQDYNNIESGDDNLSIFQVFKKVLINIKEKEINTKRLDEYPDNFEFDLTIICPFDSKSLNFININNGTSRINKIELKGYPTNISIEQFNIIIKQLLSLNPREIQFKHYSANHLSYSELFSNLPKSLKAITIYNTADHIEPIDISKIYNNSTQLSLESINFNINFTDLILFYNSLINLNTYNQPQVNQFYNNKNYFNNIASLKEDWNLMIEMFSNNSSIKELSIGTYNYDIPKVNKENFNVDIIANGFASILSSPNSNIKTLTLDSYGFIVDNPKFLYALANNKTINTLVFYNINIESIVKNVLNQSQNNNIKHLVFKSCSSTFEENLDSIINFSSNQLDLYSITFYISTLDLANIVFNQFKSLPNPPKEIIIYINSNINFRKFLSKILK